MKPVLNKNFKDMLSALNDAGAEYLIVGAYALAAWGRARATGDIDIWVRPTPENAAKVWCAMGAFRAPRSGVTETDFATEDVVFQIGVEPERIDIITTVSGLDFEGAWNRRRVAVYDGFALPVLTRDDLLENKRAAGRLKDLGDLDWLEKHNYDLDGE